MGRDGAYVPTYRRVSSIIAAVPASVLQVFLCVQACTFPVPLQTQSSRLW